MYLKFSNSKEDDTFYMYTVYIKIAPYKKVKYETIQQIMNPEK